MVIRPENKVYVVPLLEHRRDDACAYLCTAQTPLVPWPVVLSAYPQLSTYTTCYVDLNYEQKATQGLVSLIRDHPYVDWPYSCSIAVNINS